MAVTAALKSEFKPDIRPSEKDNYLIRSLSKITYKRWEHYVINRVDHRLSDHDIEFVCQQAIRRVDKNNPYLADLFFPQLGIYLEIDEGHHAHEENQIADAKRRLDIVDATGFKEFRIKAHETNLEALDREVESFIQEIQERKTKAVSGKTFRPWDYERRFSPIPHLEAGYIEVDAHAAFRTHKEALQCFGYDKGHLQKAVWNLPASTVNALGKEGAWMVWFPKLYEYKDWSNRISDDGTEITEECKIPNHTYTDIWDRRIVMAHARDELNRTLYRFLGVFEVIPEFSTGRVRKFRRVETRIPTVWPMNLQK